jgi:hypothetical protein
MLPWSRLRGDLRNALGDLPPCGAAALLGGERLASKRLRDHFDLGGVKSALGMIDQDPREGEQDRLVLDERAC